jgi:putative nucleotidyltransferase with HDIG domain
MDQTRGQRFLSELPEIKRDLPFHPELLRTLFAQTGEDSFASMEEIAATISQDPGMTARVLTLANSAFYGLQAQVSTVSRALTVLGLKELRNLVLVLGMQAMAGKSPAPEGFDMRQFWEHQLSTALCARHLAEATGAADPDLLFTSGLLHDFGKLLTALHRPEDWQAIESLRRSEDISYREAEERHWGLEHGLIGALTLNSWDLPPELTEPVNWHHAPDLSPDFQSQCGLLCLADALHHRLDDPSFPVPDGWRPVLRAHDQQLPDMDGLEDALWEKLQEPGFRQFVNHVCAGA